MKLPDNFKDFETKNKLRKMIDDGSIYDFMVHFQYKYQIRGFFVGVVTALACVIIGALMIGG